MTAVALRGLLGRKLRAVLTSFAIVLGVAMISGTLVLTDTIQKAFDGVFESSYKSTSVIVSGREVVKNSTNGKATVPESVLAKVQALPDVASAAGSIIDFTGTGDTVTLIDDKGKKLGGNGGAPTFGFGIDPSKPRFNPLTLDAGKWASGPHQVVIDAGTASDHGYRVGDTIGAAGDGPASRYTISGVAKLGGVSSIGGATIAVFDVPTAQTILHKEGQFDAIAAAAKPGVSDERLAQEISDVVPSTALVQTAGAQAKDDAKDTNSGINFIRYFLLGFAGVALFVGAFVIFNTISITVAQRTREFATLRTIGASRRQVRRSVIIEAFAIGLVASVIGLFLGLALAFGLNAIFVALGIDLPRSGTVFATRTVIVSLLVGTIVTVVAGLFPAFRATRVPPIAAVREGAVLPRSRFAPAAPYFAAALLVLAVLLLIDGLFIASGVASVLIPLLAGTLALFVGTTLMSGRLVRPLAAVLGEPARRFGGTPGQLASENTLRNTGRTASTAAALMIGLALVTFVAVLGEGLRVSDEEGLRNGITADYVVTSDNGFDPFVKAAGDAAAAAPEAQLVSSVRTDQGQVAGSDVEVEGVDASTIASVYKFDWEKGSDTLLPLLGGNGAILSKGFAKDHDLALGSSLKLKTPDGDDISLVVKGLVTRAPKIDPLFGQVVISQLAFDASFPRPKNSFTFVNTRGGASPQTERALKTQLAAFPDTKLQTKDDWAKERAGGIGQLLNLLYVLLALSVVVSLFGMINTLVLSVFERTRELGMLRAVGMTRRQVRGMVGHESVITALIGAGLGLPLGVFLAGLVTRALSDQGVGFHLPILNLVIFAAIAVVLGIIAALWPARRAARLNVLEALQYE